MSPPAEISETPGLEEGGPVGVSGSGDVLYSLIAGRIEVEVSELDADWGSGRSSFMDTALDEGESISLR
jgi:hypothetical protein